MFRCESRTRLYLFGALLPVLVVTGRGCTRERPSPKAAVTPAVAAVPHFGAPPTVKEADLFTSNGDCLVCHPSLAKELISAKHLKHGIGCRHCHGTSDDHMQDEMQMTPPDFLYGRSEIPSFCKVCHPEHKYPERVDAFFTEWRGKDRPNGRVVAENSVCTDCHGEHNIHKEKTAAGEKKEAELAPLFDGQSLTGWSPSGHATWTVENGAIVARQGPGSAGGELLSAADYKNFLLSVTYKVEWPASAAIRLRHQSTAKTLQVAIIESADPAQYTGSLLSGAGKPLAVNANKESVNRDGWNTLSVRAKGRQVEVFLNGNSVAVAGDGSSDRGRIGFSLAPGPEFAKMKLTIREVLLQAIE